MVGGLSTPETAKPYSKHLFLVLVCVGLVTAFAPAVSAQTAAQTSTSPVGPVFNPSFELGPMAGPAGEQLQGSPVDHCIGVGHQVLWGTDTVQGEATGGAFDPPGSTPDPSQADPQGAAERVADDPEGEARYTAGVGHCVYGKDTGYDVAWANPVERTDQPAHWSMDVRNPSVEWGYDYDGDASDREARFATNNNGSRHNMWQWMGSPHQAWTPNAEALTLAVEQGTPPDGASIILSLATVPQESRETNGYYLACDLVFSAEQIRNADDVDDDGKVEVSPLNANFRARRSSHCAELEEKFENGSDAEKREVLGSTRITQLSFWGWNGAEEPVVVDDVQIEGATTVAEEVANGNVDTSP